VTRYATRLSPESYDTACYLAGDALWRRLPYGITLLDITEGRRWAEFRAGVYIAADVQNTVRYVGSSVRTEFSNVGDRIEEHVRTGRAAAWTRLMIVPLHPDTDEPLVRRIEGRIGAALSPLDIMRLPALATLRRSVRRR